MTSDELELAVHEHLARIHRAALVLCGNPWDADDLVQETFLVFARQKDRFEGRSRLYTWLYGILLNVERRARRRVGMARKKLRVVWNDEVGSPNLHPPAETPLEVREWKNSLWARVAQLPEGQRQSLVLRYSEGLRYEEIAEILGCPVGTVKSRMYHGLLALRQLLGANQHGAVPFFEFPPEGANHAV